MGDNITKFVAEIGSNVKGFMDGTGAVIQRTKAIAQEWQQTTSKVAQEAAKLGKSAGTAFNSVKEGAQKAAAETGKFVAKSSQMSASWASTAGAVAASAARMSGAVASAVASSAVQFTRFIRNANGAGQAAYKMAADWNKAGQSIGSAVTRIGLLVGGMTAVTVAQFGSFEQTMIRIGSITRTIGTKDFGALKKAAIDAGASTQYTALESAEALENLSRAGLSVKDSIAALPRTLQLATGAQISISRSAEIGAKTMRAFGLGVENLGTIMDVLIAGSNSANQTLDELYEGLVRVGSVATSTGNDLYDMTALISKMADAGIDTATAGTAVRNAIIHLAAPTKKASQLLKEMNIDVSGGLMNALSQLEVGLQNVNDPMDRLAIATELFGIRGGPQLIEILNKGTGATRDFANMLRQSAGLAEKQFGENLASMRNQIELAKSALETLVIELGEKLAPTVVKVSKEFVAFLSNNKTEILDQLTTVFGSVISMLSSMSEWLPQVAGEMFALADSVAYLLGPIFEFIKAHPGIMATMLALKAGSLLGVNKALWDTGTALISTGKAISTLLIPMVTSLIAWLGTLEGAIIATQLALLSLATLGIAAVIAGIVALGVWLQKSYGIFDPLVNGAKAVINMLVEVWEEFRNDVMAAMGPALSQLGETFSELGQVIGELLTLYLRPSMIVWNLLWKLLKGSVWFAFEATKAVVKGLGVVIAGVANDGLQLLTLALRAVSKIISNVFVPFVESGVYAVNMLATAARKALGPLEDVLSYLGLIQSKEERERGQQLDEQVARLQERIKAREAAEAGKAPASAQVGPQPQQKPSTQQPSLTPKMPGGQQIPGGLPASALAEAHAESGGAAGGMSDGGEGGADKTAQKIAEKLQGMMADKKADQLDTQASGAGELFEFMKLGPSVEQLKQFVMNMEGATDKLAEDAAKTYQFMQRNGSVTEDEMESLSVYATQAANAEKERQKEIEKTTEKTKEAITGSMDFGRELLALKGTIPNEQLRTFITDFNSLNSQLNSGAISLDQWKAGMRELEQASAKSSEFAASLSSLASEGKLTTIQQGLLQGSMTTLQNQFVSGKINAQQYAEELKWLNKQTDDAVKKTERENAAKKAQALMRGDWKNAGVNPQQDIQDRLNDMASQRYNQMIDNVVNGMYGFTDAMGTATAGLGQMQQTAVNFSGSFDPQQASETMNTIFSFLNTQEGQVTSLVNNIAQLEQNLRYLTQSNNSFASADGIKRIRGQLEQMYGQLNQLQNQPSFIEQLSGVDQVSPINVISQGGGFNVTINTPSLHPSQVPALVDQFEREMSRRGNRR